MINDRLFEKVGLFVNFLVTSSKTHLKGCAFSQQRRQISQDSYLCSQSANVGKLCFKSINVYPY